MPSEFTLRAADSRTLEAMASVCASDVDALWTSVASRVERLLAGKDASVRVAGRSVVVRANEEPDLAQRIERVATSEPYPIRDGVMFMPLTIGEPKLATMIWNGSMESSRLVMHGDGARIGGGDCEVHIEAVDDAVATVGRSGHHIYVGPCGERRAFFTGSWLERRKFYGAKSLVVLPTAGRRPSVVVLFESPFFVPFFAKDRKFWEVAEAGEWGNILLGCAIANGEPCGVIIARPREKANDASWWRPGDALESMPPDDVYAYVDSFRVVVSLRASEAEIAARAKRLESALGPSVKVEHATSAPGDCPADMIRRVLDPPREPAKPLVVVPPPAPTPPREAEAYIRAFIAQNRGVPPYQWRLPYHALVAIEALSTENAKHAVPSVVELGRFVVAAPYRSSSEQSDALSRIFQTLEIIRASQALADLAREIASARGNASLAHACVSAIARLGRENAIAVAALRAIDHAEAHATLRAWFEPPPPPPPPPPKKELDVAQIPILIEKLRAFIDAHRSERPPTASMPELELRTLAMYGKRAAAAVPVLLELADFAYAYSFQVDRDGGNRYDGQDLRAVSAVVRTLGAIASDPERVIPVLRRHLEPNEKSLREAPPLQFWSTIDKYDREEDLRFAMQELIDACREALASFGAR